MAIEQEQVKNLIKFGLEKGWDKEKIRGAVNALHRRSQTTQQPGTAQEAEQSRLQETGQDIKETVSGIGEALKKRGAFAKETFQQGIRGELDPIRQGVRQVGGAIGAVGDVLGGAAIGIGKAFLPQKTEEAIGRGVTEAAQKALETETGKSAVGAYTRFAEAHPEAVKDIAGVANIASLIPVGAAAKAGVRAGKSAVSGVKRGVGAVAGAGERAALGFGTGIERAGQGVAESGVGAAVRGGAEKVGAFARTAPEKVALKGKIAKETAEEISKEVPTVKRAVEAGISLKDTRTLTGASKETLDVLDQMARESDNVVRGASDLPSGSIPGRAMQSRISQADKLRGAIGQRLGVIAQSLKGKTVAAKQKVLIRLREVPGLQRLTVNNKGQLDFSRTTLKSSLTASDRIKINQLYNSIKGQDAFDLHQFRQEIFEALGGRKKAREALTATQERAFDATRKGIADALETISPAYKSLSKEYAKLAEPLKNLRKRYRGLEGAADDILEENAANLMRRFTGSAKSGLEIQESLRKLDDALKAAGLDDGIDLKRLQEFQNILDNIYPDLVKSTGFAGQAALGIRKGLGGIVSTAADVAQKALGNTPEFQQKVLRELIDSLRER